jgi:DNA (cytosine-5)-methyltransferase 1
MALYCKTLSYDPQRLISGIKVVTIRYMKKLRVIELFAGVGGFRLGLEGANKKNARYEIVWSNQWEPATKRQSASDIYIARFGKDGHSNEDIEKVIEHKFNEIPNHDLLVGGFPCQDYSVARTLSQAKGLIGEKGVLWWSIYTILKRKGDKAPSYIFLENVDRLLKSPAKQRGRDFAVMLASLSDLGYAVEWRVINAADYGFPQRRRRVFIMGYKKGTKLYDRVKAAEDPAKFILKDGVLAEAFPATPDSENHSTVELIGSLVRISEDFSVQQPKLSPFLNSGLMIDRRVATLKVHPSYGGKRVLLSDLLIDEKEVPEEFFINDAEFEKWKYLKGGKKEQRKTRSGHVYYYSEGPVVFPDALDRPSRTVVTGEGGSSPSRFKHVVRTPSGRYRRLTPLELERLDMFPDNHTQIENISNVVRAFVCGNALVVGAIERVGAALLKHSD